jgi:hypothetical protein
VAQVSWLVERMRAEYEALPGLKLTRVQACRLWSVSDSVCGAALDLLIAEGFLWLAPSGRYVALPRPGSATPNSEFDIIRCPYCHKRNAFVREETIHGQHISLTLRCAGCQRLLTVGAMSA